jgi:hypothetical protein
MCGAEVPTRLASSRADIPFFSQNVLMLFVGSIFVFMAMLIS